MGFEVDQYDRTRPLVIDPLIISPGITISTLLGGSTDNSTGRAIALDSWGNIYIAGFTYALDFPTLSAAQKRFERHPGRVYRQNQSDGNGIDLLDLFRRIEHRRVSWNRSGFNWSRVGHGIYFVQRFPVEERNTVDDDRAAGRGRSQAELLPGRWCSPPIFGGNSTTNGEAIAVDQFEQRICHRLHEFNFDDLSHHERRDPNRRSGQFRYLRHEIPVGRGDYRRRLFHPARWFRLRSGVWHRGRFSGMRLHYGRHWFHEPVDRKRGAGQHRRCPRRFRGQAESERDITQVLYVLPWGSGRRAGKCHRQSIQTVTHISAGKPVPPEPRDTRERGAALLIGWTGRARRQTERRGDSV